MSIFGELSDEAKQKRIRLVYERHHLDPEADQPENSLFVIMDEFFHRNHADYMFTETARIIALYEGEDLIYNQNLFMSKLANAVIGQKNIGVSEKMLDYLMMYASIVLSTDYYNRIKSTNWLIYHQCVHMIHLWACYRLSELRSLTNNEAKLNPVLQAEYDFAQKVIETVGNQVDISHIRFRATTLPDTPKEA